MDPSANPYAPPADWAAGSNAPATSGHYYRQGDQLVIAKGAALPDVCIVTGQPTNRPPRTDKVQWYPPWTAILFLVIGVFALILMMVLRKFGSFSYFWSEQAQKKRNRATGIGLAMTFGSFLLPVIAFQISPAVGGVSMLLCFILFFAGIIVASVVARPYQVKKIDDNFIYLKVAPEFWHGLERASQPPTY